MNSINKIKLDRGREGDRVIRNESYLDYRRASPELFLKKGVPHQFSFGWDIFQNKKSFLWKSVFIQQPNNKSSTPASECYMHT